MEKELLVKALWNALRDTNAAYMHDSAKMQVTIQGKGAILNLNEIAERMLFDINVTPATNKR